jgi:phasin family protein
MSSETITPAVKSHLEAQLSFCNDISKRILDSAQQIAELHLHLAQTFIDDLIAGSQQLLSVKDPTEFSAIMAAQTQPAVERMRAYQQRWSGILAGTQAELTKAAETHVPETSRTAAAVADEMLRKASEETEKAAQRQKDVMERITNPIHRPAGSAKDQERVH